MFAPSRQSIQADTHRSSAPMYVSRTTRMRVVVKVHDAKIENVMDKLSLHGIRDSVAERLPTCSIESISARSGCVIMELHLSTQHAAAAASASALERLNTSTLPLTSSSNAPLTESIQSDRLALDLGPASWLQLSEIHKLIGNGSNTIVQVTSSQRASPQHILSSHVMKLNDGAWYDVSSSFQGRGDNPEGGSTHATAASQLSPSQPRCLVGPHHGSSSLILDMVMYWRESSQSGGPVEEDETESHENSRQPPGNLTLDSACTSAMQGYLHGPMHVITCENLRRETQSASQVSALDGMPSPLALHAKDHGIVNPEGFVALSKGVCVEVTLHGHRLCTRRVTRERHMTVNAPLLGQQWSSSTRERHMTVNAPLLGQQWSSSTTSLRCFFTLLLWMLPYLVRLSWSVLSPTASKLGSEESSRAQASGCTFTASCSY
ncbi:hypothetical protein CEUSTIGMA_g6740.t1 [Chlamydomonas eustigma]|uniref:Uncharacterized protein n=1 Tax=Chlamydomonas eustigma TaxID=1157962 RepID=A0A250X8Q6_9CHLO|nr:hypothetical protein CEUSTIGMA_g6740.t1 [Chlamydomonas eustigma]|eukprot:GAX79299.1 hypothetical protein CEUSTIGMA_g6740.t1 [Chlamydomonas eustigma]